MWRLGQQQVVWTEFASRVGGAFEHNSITNTNRVVTRVEPWSITLRKGSEDTVSSYGSTVMAAPYVRQRKLRCTVWREALADRIAAVLGMGGKPFSGSILQEEFVYTGHDELAVFRLFTDTTVAEQMLAQPALRLAIQNGESLTGLWKPRGLDELVIRCDDLSLSVERLCELHALAVALLERLCEIGVAYRLDPSSDHESMSLVRGTGAPTGGSELLRTGKEDSGASERELLRPDSGGQKQAGG